MDNRDCLKKSIDEKQSEINQLLIRYELSKIHEVIKLNMEINDLLSSLAAIEDED